MQADTTKDSSQQFQKEINGLVADSREKVLILVDLTVSLAMIMMHATRPVTALRLIRTTGRENGRAF
jgi:hypothetical protein